MTRETASLEFDRLSATDFFSKIAALTPEEAEAFQAAVRRHAEFEAKAAKGNMSSGDTAQMRHNVERLKAYRQKKKSDSFKIPDWVRNPSGAPPPSAPPPGAREQKWRTKDEDFQRAWEEAQQRSNKRRQQAGDRWGQNSHTDPFSGSRPNPGGSPPGGGPNPDPSSWHQEQSEWDRKWKERWEASDRRWEEERQKRQQERQQADQAWEEEYNRRHSDAFTPEPRPTGLDASGVGHALAALGGLGYMAFAPQKKDPNEAPSELKGRIGAHMQTTVPLGIGGHLVGRLLKDVGGHNYAPAIGALSGAALGALGGEALFSVAAPFDAENRAADADASPSAARELRRDAKRTGASLGRGELLYSGIRHLPYAVLGGTRELPQLAASATSHALGKGLYDEYINAHAMQRFNKSESKKNEKTAFSTNAFSGPMNPNIQSGASIIPPFKQPSLRAPVEKTAKRYKLEGDAVIEVGADGKSLGKGPIKLARAPTPGARMVLIDLDGVHEVEKTSAGAPTRGNFMMASDVPPFKVPSLRAPIEKNSDMMDTYYPYAPGDFKPAKLTGKTAAFNPILQAATHAKTIGTPKVSAPPGPSIADIAKPKGPGMGAGIAGAFKGSIGGTAGVSQK